MTPTNRLPAIEALGEALAALNGERERFRAGRDYEGKDFVDRHVNGNVYCRNVIDALQAREHLANSGWTITPGPTVNAGEETP